eukprot:TRINITY_DN7648_c0_g1_i2.p1 TRINITY_DN7648_c0_g1~~TRINITY_DN7648_c0_g1_i2.p1  ORF type:complete len:1348 (+),score=318.90 TRINITY_DN7648_c0_g1_i2:78-4046(+)
MAAPANGTLPPQNGTAAPETTCSFSWGTFPEFLLWHCVWDRETGYVVFTGCFLGIALLGLCIVEVVSTWHRRKERKLLEQMSAERCKSNHCSFAVTLGRNVEQEWWRCRTCYGVSDMGCCTACASVCHKGHNLERSAMKHNKEARYCSCGSSGGGCMVNDDFDTALRKQLLGHCHMHLPSRLGRAQSVRYHWHGGSDSPLLSARVQRQKGHSEFRVFEMGISPVHSLRAAPSLPTIEVVSVGIPGSGREAEDAAAHDKAMWDQVYSLMDVDGDGILSAKEIADHFRTHSELQARMDDADREVLGELLQSLDADGDGYVDRAEFGLLMQKLGAASKKAAVLEVVVMRAEGLMAADTFYSDPFVIVTVPGAKGDLTRTSVCPRTLSPVWNERFVFELPAQAGEEGEAVDVQFTVMDHDDTGSPDFLGYAELSLNADLLSSLLAASREYQLRLVPRPGNADDRIRLQHSARGFGVLDVQLRTSAATGSAAETAAGPERGSGGVLSTQPASCGQCHRQLLWFVRDGESGPGSVWMSDLTGEARQTRLLPRCPCGALLVPDAWRDRIRCAFEPYWQGGSARSVETAYPIGEHLQLSRLADWVVLVVLAGVNAATIVLAYSRRPTRDTHEVLNLAVHWMLFCELLILAGSVVYTAHECYAQGYTIFGLLGRMPHRVLGAHALRPVPVGWLPARWGKVLRKHWREGPPQAPRYRVGVALATATGAALAALVPAVLVFAKLAFLRHEFEGDWEPVSMLFALNFVSNLRHIVSTVASRPDRAHRLPHRLWLDVMQSLRGRRSGPDALTTQSDIPLLYELVVLNGRALMPHTRDEKDEAGGAAADPTGPGADAVLSDFGSDPDATMSATLSGTQKPPQLSQQDTNQASSFLAQNLNLATPQFEERRAAATSKAQADLGEQLKAERAELEFERMELRLQVMRLRRQRARFDAECVRAVGHPLVQAAQEAAASAAPAAPSPPRYGAPSPTAALAAAAGALRGAVQELVAQGEAALSGAWPQSRIPRLHQWCIRAAMQEPQEFPGDGPAAPPPPPEQPSPPTRAQERAAHRHPAVPALSSEVVRAPVPPAAPTASTERGGLPRGRWEARVRQARERERAELLDRCFPSRRGVRPRRATTCCPAPPTAAWWSSAHPAAHARGVPLSQKLRAGQQQQQQQLQPAVPDAGAAARARAPSGTGSASPDPEAHSPLARGLTALAAAAETGELVASPGRRRGDAVEGAAAAGAALAKRTVRRSNAALRHAAPRPSVSGPRRESQGDALDDTLLSLDLSLVDRPHGPTPLSSARHEHRAQPSGDGAEDPGVDSSPRSPSAGA